VTFIINDIIFIQIYTINGFDFECLKYAIIVCWWTFELVLVSKAFKISILTIIVYKYMNNNSRKNQHMHQTMKLYNLYIKSAQIAHISIYSVYRILWICWYLYERSCICWYIYVIYFSYAKPSYFEQLMLLNIQYAKYMLNMHSTS